MRQCIKYSTQNFGCWAEHETCSFTISNLPCFIPAGAFPILCIVLWYSRVNKKRGHFHWFNIRHTNIKFCGKYDGTCIVIKHRQQVMVLHIKVDTGFHIPDYTEAQNWKGWVSTIWYWGLWVFQCWHIICETIQSVCDNYSPLLQIMDFWLSWSKF